VNIRSFVREDLVQNKANEDKLDAIVSAYAAAYW
jgi:predicted RNase H-like nuclease